LDLLLDEFRFYGPSLDVGEKLILPYHNSRYLSKIIDLFFVGFVGDEPLRVHVLFDPSNFHIVFDMSGLSIPQLKYFLKIKKIKKYL
jgi:hypothetical protein